MTTTTVSEIETLRAKALITAVREDKVVGRGTCSCIDEAYTDAELWEVIRGAKSARWARSLARRIHNSFVEREKEAMADLAVERKTMKREAFVRDFLAEEYSG